MNNIIKALNWRYATKKFNPEKKLTDEQINTLLEATRLSPSSFGLQPYKIFVVTNPELKEKLKAAAYNQTPLTDASHILIFTVPTNFSEAEVDKYLTEVSNARSIDLENLKGYKDMMMGFVGRNTIEQLKEWSTRQVYLALGQLLTVAAIEKIDIAPMEGFDPMQFDNILNLKDKNLTTVVIAGLGFRDETDPYASLAKVRFKKEDIFIELK